MGEFVSRGGSQCCLKNFRNIGYSLAEFIGIRHTDIFND